MMAFGPARDEYAQLSAGYVARLTELAADLVKLKVEIVVPIPPPERLQCGVPRTSRGIKSCLA